MVIGEQGVAVGGDVAVDTRRLSEGSRMASMHALRMHGVLAVLLFLATPIGWLTCICYTGLLHSSGREAAWILQHFSSGWSIDTAKHHLLAWQAAQPSAVTQSQPLQAAQTVWQAQGCIQRFVSSVCGHHVCRRL